MEQWAIVEAALFLADHPLSIRELAYAFGISEDEVGEALGKLGQILDSSGHGLELAHEGGGYILRVRERIVDRVKSFAPHQDIPEPVLRTLAVIAYHGSILQSELVRLRGQRAYSHIRELIARGFIEAQKEGPTSRLTVTQDFLRYFNLKTEAELRSLLDKSMTKAR